MTKTQHILFSHIKQSKLIDWILAKALRILHRDSYKGKRIYPENRKHIDKNWETEYEFCDEYRLPSLAAKIICYLFKKEFNEKDFTESVVGHCLSKDFKRKPKTFGAIIHEGQNPLWQYKEKEILELINKL